MGPRDPGGSGRWECTVESRVPVRLLLLERQRWDRALDTARLRGDDSDSRGMVLGPGQAEWFSALCGNRRETEQAPLVACNAEPGVIELTALFKL